MNKLAKIVLGAVAVIGGYLVTEGVLNGEQLSEIQNVIGMVLAGGGLTGFSILTVLSLFPKELVSKAYDKAVATYGETQVNNVLDNFDKALAMMGEVKELVTGLRADLELDRQIKQELGVYEPLSDELKSQL